MKRQMLLLGWLLAVQITALAQFSGQNRSMDLRNELLTKGVNATAADPVTVAWVSHYNGPVNSGLGLGANAIAVDRSGNIYVTGISEGSGTGTDYATIKYTAAGTEAWVARYNGPANGWDEAAAIVVDDLGNVYVTGNSEGMGTGSDYATIKYTATGTEAWVARYNGPGYSSDYAEAIAVDASGNVYVTGRSNGSNTYSDYATIKYTAAGTGVWLARYNTPCNGEDKAFALAVDASSNVYVTGYSEGLGTDLDYATIKYTATGTEAWVARYNGPANGGDAAWDIAVDGSGNVYVTGESEGLGTDQDYATIKYTATGTEVWVARYNALGYSGGHVALALVVDALGSIYVTGVSYGFSTDYDYATIKYTATGTEAWVARYNGQGNGYDEAVALAVDGSGNVYVTGRSIGLDNSNEFATIKYTANGVEEWVALYNRPGSGYDDYAQDFAIDGDGNVYVTGYSIGFDGSIYTTVKYGQRPTLVEEKNGLPPASFVLEQNYPNPFNQTTTISFSLAANSFVKLKVFDVLGTEVATLLSEDLPQGYYTKHWNVVDLPSGVYFYRLQAGSFVDTKKLVLLK